MEIYKKIKPPLKQVPKLMRRYRHEGEAGNDLMVIYDGLNKNDCFNGVPKSPDISMGKSIPNYVKDRANLFVFRDRPTPLQTFP
jgi:hypothetical protein